MGPALCSAGLAAAQEVRPALAGPGGEVLPLDAAAGGCELELVHEGPRECVLASDPVIEGDMLYMSMGQDFCPAPRGLRIYDISDPHQPRERGRLPTGWGLVAVRGELAAVMDGYFRTIDVSDPDAPRQLAEIRLSERAGAVTIVGDTAFVTAQETGLVIIDISDPRAPAIVSSLEAPGIATHIAVDGDVLYMTTREPVPGVRIVDISTGGTLWNSRSSRRAPMPVG